MVIVHLSGGFGNQLYSYAFGYAVAKARGEELWIDTAIQDAPWFFRNPDILHMNITFDKRITYKIGNRRIDKVFNRVRFRNAIGWTTKFIKEKDMPDYHKWFDTCVKTKGNIYLKGNWSYEECFEYAKQEVIDRFTFKDKLSEGAQKIADDIISNKNTVGIHYRRGDYVRIGIVISLEYFIDAMASMAQKLENPVFYCFSEEIAWVKEQFKGLPYDIRYAEYESENSGIEDFQLYSMCENQIASNSSYSWWGAYLNKNSTKYVIAPTNYTGMWSSNLYPKEWDIRSFSFINRNK